MSARSVCSGTRPSRYHSVRAISWPLRRPELMILTPCAPRRMAFCIARFMARRNMMRFSSCCAIESAISCASVSGLRISSMFTCTCCTPMMRRSSALSDSISSPFLPITTPGRAEKMVMRASLAGRSMSTRPTEACASFFFRKVRTFTSSASIPAKARLFPYHLELQLRFTASRKPIGLIFCPMVLVPDRDVDVAGMPEHARAATFGARMEAPLEGTTLDVDLFHLEGVDIRAVVVLGIGDRRLEQLLHQRRAALGREREDADRLVDLLAAHEVRNQPALLGREVRAAQACFGFHVGSLLLRRCRGCSRRGCRSGRRRAGRSRRTTPGSFLGALACRRMALEDARQRELAELVPDHVLGHVDRHVLLAVVHRQREADEVRHHRRAARPGLDRALVAGAARLVDLLHEVVVHEGTLLD